MISYISFAIGIVCFFLVFVTPTRIANIGSPPGDYMTLILTAAGMMLSVTGIAKRTEKSIIPVISLILSSSLFIAR